MRRILLADDSAVARAMLGGKLRAAGWDVVEASSLAEAKTVDPTGLACALLDIDLGDGDGTDVAEILVKRAVPVAFFSGADEAGISRASTFGPVFAKPSGADAAVAWAEARASG